MATGMNLAYVHAALEAMNLVFGGSLPAGPDLTYVMLSSLDAVPSGVKANQVMLPLYAYADCYNFAYAACYDVQHEQDWKRTHK